MRDARGDATVPPDPPLTSLMAPSLPGGGLGSRKSKSNFANGAFPRSSEVSRNGPARDRLKRVHHESERFTGLVGGADALMIDVVRGRVDEAKESAACCEEEEVLWPALLPSSTDDDEGRSDELFDVVGISGGNWGAADT